MTPAPAAPGLLACDSSGEGDDVSRLPDRAMSASRRPPALLRRGSSLYAPSFYAPYVLAALIRSAEAPGWLVVVPDAEQAARLADELVGLPRERRSRRCRRAACSTAPTWRRRRTCWASASGRWPRSSRAAASSWPTPSPCSSASSRSPCSRARWPGPGRRGRLRRRSWPRSPAWATSAPSRCASAASSRYAAASSTSIRRPATPVRAEFWGDTVESLRRFSVFSQRAVAEIERCLVTTSSEVDPTDDEVQAAVSQELASWELAGREETPDEAYRRAETRALARLSGRFIDLAAICEQRALRLAIGRRRRCRALAGQLRFRARDHAARRGARALLPAPARGAPHAVRRGGARPRAARAALCSSTPPGRRPPVATSRRPSATCGAWPTTAIASSSCSATPARPAAPATG